jgi:hypothetical protein
VAEERPILHEPEHGIPPGSAALFRSRFAQKAAVLAPRPNVAGCGGDENAAFCCRNRRRAARP